MRQRTADNLREIEVSAHDGGRRFMISVYVYPDTRPETLPESVHVFRVYDNNARHEGLTMPGNGDKAMRVYSELCKRGECNGLTNWETASLALEMYHDGATYADRLRLYGEVTRKGPHYVISASDMKRFAVRHGYLNGKSLAFAELIDWVSLKSWFESQRAECAENDPELIGL